MTKRQGDYLAFITDYTRLHGRAPSEADIQRHFGTTPPSVHQMVLMLEKRGLILRTPGQARSIRVLANAAGALPGDPRREESGARSNSFAGHWRIIEMEKWDQDFVDAEVDGYLRLDADGSGDFQFGYVAGSIDCQETERDGRPGIEWTWEGNNEMDPATGGGSAYLADARTLKGRISIHRGDKSGFTAVKKAGRKSRATNSRQS